MEFARAGFRVLGFDVSKAVVDGLTQGRSHVQDVPSAEVARFTKDATFTATTDLARLHEPDVVSICVPTPLSKTKDPDVSYVLAIERLVAVSSTEAAELVKILENTFRSVNIGLVNEMAIVCDKLGVDVWEVIEAAATKPFGFMKFTPGPGVGGHCIPLDPH